MRQQLLGLLLTGSLMAGACGDEGQESANSDVENYCEVTRSIFRGQEEPPSDEEMDKWEAAAADQIRSEVRTAASAYRDLNNDAQPDFAKLEEEPLVTSFDRVEAFNEEKCGIRAE